MRTLLYMVLFLAMALPIHAQEKTQDAAKPATKLELFQGKTGIVIVRGYANVGSITGQYGSHVAVEASEYWDASNPASRVTGVRITVTQREQESISFIDSDEIDSLVQGLDYIAKANKSITRLQSFEVEYRTKGDFSVTVFSTRDGDLMAGVSSGRIGKRQAFLSMGDLPELKRLIVAAKAATDEPSPH